MSDALLVSLSGAVDMALRCPEVGSVNFNLLNAVLQAMIHQMKLDECSVEIRGPETECLQKLMATANSTLSVKLTDYSVNYDPRKKEQQKESEKTWNIVVVDTKQETDLTKEDTAHQPHVIVPVSDERFQELESGMDYLKVKMKEILELPKDSNIVEAMRSLEYRDAEHTSVLNPASEMWQMLSLSKRIDTVEAGITQLTTTIDAFMNEIVDTLYNESEDSANAHITGNETTEPRETSFVKVDQHGEESKTKDVSSRTERASQALDARKKLSMNHKNVPSNSRNDSNSRVSRSSFFLTFAQRLDALEKKIEILPFDHEKTHDVAPPSSPVGSEIDDTIVLSQLEMVKRTVSHLEGVVLGVSERLDNLANTGNTGNNLGGMKKRLDEIEETLKELKSGFTGKKQTDLTPGTNADQSKRIEDKILSTLDKKLKIVNEEQSRNVASIQNQILMVERDLGGMEEQVNSLLEQEDRSTVIELVKQVEQLQEDVAKISTAAEDMVTGHTDRKEIIDKMLEDIEDMKVLKADRQDVDEALLEKADTDIMKDGLNRKVSHHHFEEVYEEIRTSFQDSADRLKEQEELWFKTLEDIQIAVGNKIDKIDEIDPLRRNMNQKIRVLQDQIDILNQSKEEQDAAATKKRIIRDMNCLSCDKPAYIKKFNEHSQFPEPPVVSGKPSMKPYLTYELDAVRQQKKCLTQGRNMNFLEQAVQQNKPAEQKSVKTGRLGHLCNRYCGGSHTITTAQQRVTYAQGHCLEQLGPKVKSLQDSFMVGTDGKVYKSNENAETRRHSCQNNAPPVPPTCNMFPCTGGSSGMSTERTAATSGPRPIAKNIEGAISKGLQDSKIVNESVDDDDYEIQMKQDITPRRIYRDNSLLQPPPITLDTIQEETSSTGTGNTTSRTIEPLDLSGIISPRVEREFPEKYTSSPVMPEKSPNTRIASLMKIHIKKAAATRDSLSTKIDTTSLKASLAKRPSTRRGSRRGSVIARQQTTQLSGDDLLDPIKNPIPSYYLPDPNKVRFGNRPDHNKMVLVTLENYDHVKAIDRPILPERVADRERLVKEEKKPTKKAK
ncbi:no individualized sperm [Carabus blaptoides fortunei]